VGTTISGLQVAVLFDAAGVLETLSRSGGHHVEIDDGEAWSAQLVLAREEGMLVEPAGATALAGLLADARQGRLTPGDDVVVVATGAGYKDAVALDRVAGDAPLEACTTEEIGDVLADLTGRTGG
jgi:threonine synthase